jgi:sulfate-transporting ATPase
VIGPTVKMAYVDQSRDCLDGSKTVFELAQGGDILTIGKFEMPSRAYIGRFNFKGGDQQKLVGNLSGGARPPAPGQDPDGRRQRAAARRTVQRPRRGNPARAGRRAARIRRLRWSSPRSLVPRPHLHPHPGGRRRFAMDLLPGNYQEYEEDKRKRLGEEGAKPKRIRYKPITR